MTSLTKRESPSVEAVPAAGYELAVSYYATLDSPRSRATAVESLRRVAKSLGLLLVDEHGQPLRDVRGRTRGDERAIPWAEMCRREDLDSLLLIRQKLVKREDLSPATRNVTLSHLRGVLGVAFDEGAIGQHFHAVVRRRLKNTKGSRPEKGRALGDTEIAALLDQADRYASPKGPLLRAVLLIGIGTGLRRAELCRLRVADVVGREVIHVGGKGEVTATCPLHNETRAEIRRWLQVRRNLRWRHDKLFGSPEQGKQLSTGLLWLLVKDWAEDAGVPRFGIHDARRTFASRMLAGGLDLAEVQRLMHHRSPSTTARYDHRGESALAERRRAVKVWVQTGA